MFPSRTGGLMQPSSLRTPLRRACLAAGVTPISPHGLRYSFNHAAKRVATHEVVRSITGHVTEEMTAHYDWVVDDEKHAAVRRVARLVTGCDSPCDTEGPQREAAGSGVAPTGRTHGATESG